MIEYSTEKKVAWFFSQKCRFWLNFQPIVLHEFLSYTYDQNMKRHLNVMKKWSQHFFNTWSTFSQQLVNISVTNVWGGNHEKCPKNDQKIDFLKSMQWLPPMSWVIRDRIGGLVLPLKTFYDHFRIRWRNRKNRSKIFLFDLELPPRPKKSILWPF